MKFGVFDHIDEAGVPVGQQFEERLALIERYEHAGFHAYHLAEHHGTPLGHAPSPSVFLAAATQRTTTLRLGPLVYCLPLYHPLRLIEEVCMLDHLSDGRLQLGVGAGVSPIEVGFFDVDWDSRRERFDETFEILLKGLASDELTHHGPRAPLRRRADDALPRPAPAPAAVVRHLARRPRRVGRRARGQRRRPAARRRWSGRSPTPTGPRGRPAAARPQDIPFMGVSRLIVVAETDDEAMGVARRAYRRWFESINLLWRKYDVPSPLDGVLPEDFADWHAAGAGFAGTPAKAIEYVAAQEEEAGINYFCADLVFGDITFEEASRTVELFESEIIPAFDPVAAKSRSRGAPQSSRASPRSPARWPRRGGARAPVAGRRGGRRRPRPRPSQPRSRA